MLDALDYLRGLGIITFSTADQLIREEREYRFHRDRRQFSLNTGRIFYRALAGTSEESLSSAVTRFWDMYWPDSLFPFTIPLMSLLSAHTRTVLISGSCRELLTPLQERLRADYLFATSGRKQHGRFDGRLAYELGSAGAKERKLQVFRKSLPWDPSYSLAMGDSDGDIPLLKAVDARNAFVVAFGRSRPQFPVDPGWSVMYSEDEVLPAIKRRTLKIFGTLSS
jgi:phosphoserine phosphatase